MVQLNRIHIIKVQEDLYSPQRTCGLASIACRWRSRNKKGKRKTGRQPISVAPVKGRPPASPFALLAASSPRSALLRTAGCSKLHRTFSLRRRPAGSIPFYSIHTKTGTPKASLFLCGASEGNRTPNLLITKAGKGVVFPTVSFVRVTPWVTVVF